jgi:hypothetical protein
MPRLRKIRKGTMMSNEKIQGEEENDKAAWAGTEFVNDAADEEHLTDLAGSESKDEYDLRRTLEYRFIKEEQIDPSNNHTTTPGNMSQHYKSTEFDTAVSELHSHFNVVGQHRQAAETALHRMTDLKQAQPSNPLAQYSSTTKVERERNEINMKFQTGMRKTNYIPQVNDGPTVIDANPAVNDFWGPEALDTFRTNHIKRARKSKTDEIDTELQPRPKNDTVDT